MKQYHVKIWLISGYATIEKITDSPYDFLTELKFSGYEFKKWEINLIGTI